MLNLYECKKIYSNYTQEFINLAVISDYVYIGGNNSLIQLNSSLDIVKIIPMEGSNWLLTPYKIKNKETILIACDYKGGDQTECIGYKSNLSIVKKYIEKDIRIKKPQARYTTTTIGSDNVLTIATSECLKPPMNLNKCFAISNYKEEIRYLETYAVRYRNTTQKNKFSFDFRTVVGNGNYTYFLFVLNHTVSKLGKICKDTNTVNQLLNAYEDVPIFCPHNGVNFTTAQDLMFWNNDLLVVFTDGTASVICRFTNVFGNFEISRKERLKCRDIQPKNKYFDNPSLEVCYNEIKKKCKSPTFEEVSMMLVLMLECRSKGGWVSQIVTM